MIEVSQTKKVPFTWRQSLALIKRLLSLGWLFLILFTISSPSLAASLSYSGRLVQATGEPISGSVLLSVRFYTAPLGGTAVGPQLDFPNTPLLDGMFQITLTLTHQQMNDIFTDEGRRVYLEVSANGKPYPRQEFAKAPLAARIPVDGSSLSFADSGNLEVKSVPISKVQGLESALSSKLESSTLSTSTLNVASLSTNKRSGIELGPYGSQVNQTGELRFLELSGGNFVGLKAPSSLSSDLIWTLPSTAGANGEVLKTNGSGELSWLNLSEITPNVAVSGGSGGSIVDGTITDVDLSSAAAIADSKLATISSPGKVLGSAITSGIIAVNAGFAGSGSVDLKSSGGVRSEIYLRDSDNSHYISLKAPSSVANHVSFTLPPTAGNVGEVLATDGSGSLNWTAVTASNLSNANIASNAAIATSKISGPITAIAGHGLGGLATLSGVSGSEINASSILNAHIASNAAIATTKLSGSLLSVSGHGLGSLAARSSISGSDIDDFSITNADIASNAAIATSKISGPIFSIASHGLGSLATLSLVSNGQIASNAEIATSKLSGPLTAISGHGLGPLATISQIGSVEISDQSILNTDIASSAGIATSKLSGPLSAIAGHGLGPLATLSMIGSNEISNNSLLNEDIASNAAIADSKLATITSAGKVSGSAITSGTISGTTAFSASGGVDLRTTSELSFRDADNSHYLSLKSPASVANNVVWTLPSVDGGSGQVLSTNGSGLLSWASGLAPTGAASGDLTGSFPNPNLIDFGPGVGTFAKVTVDAKGRVSSGATTIGSSDIADNSILNGDIASNAAIATAKLSGSLTSVANHGLGSLAALSSISGTEILDATIANIDIASSAGIATSKISGSLVLIAGHGLGSLATRNDVSGAEIQDNTIGNADISSSAAIATSKLSGNVTSIVGHGLGSFATLSSLSDGQVSPTAAIATSKLSGAIFSITSHGLGSLATRSSISDNEVGINAAIATTKLSGSLLSITGHGLASLATLSAISDGQVASNAGILTSKLSGSLTAISGHGLGALATKATVANADVAVGAGIATNKLSGSLMLITSHGLGALATRNDVSGAEIQDNTIGNSDISTSAAIDTSKLSGALTSVANHGLGTLATLNQVGSAQIANSAITDSLVASNAAIATTKISGPLTSISGHGLGILATRSTVGTSEISDFSIVNADISSSAAIASSKLSGSVLSISGHGLGAFATVTWTPPSGNGTSGQLLSTNGSGTLSWVSPSSSSMGTGGGAAENPNSGCPTGYILVPGDTFYGTTNFCVMKYEAKFGSKGAESRAAGLPARGTVSQTVAQASCRNLGPSYALINNAEWMTLAANIANVPSNWSGGSVGSGALNRGHSDNTPANALAAVTDDNDPCNGTGQACSSTTWNDQRRTHVLSNSNVIWDLAGNVWEWVDYNNFEDKPTPATAAWTEYTVVTGTTTMPKTLLVPSNATKNWWNDSWNGATNGIGQYYAGTNSSGGALLRGASWLHGSMSGVFTAGLYLDPSDTYADLGFRCVFRPPSL